MQTCSRCQSQSPDSARSCSSCGAELASFSTSAVTLKRLVENSRVTAVRLIAPANACPSCQKAEGTYSKDAVPVLPIPGCSEPDGCLCFYSPVLDQIYP